MKPNGTRLPEEMGKDQFWRADEMVRMNGGDLDVLADFGFTPEEYRAELESVAVVSKPLWKPVKGL